VQKNYKTQITKTAGRDLDEIWEYIALDNRDAAVRFIKKLETAVKSIGRFPHRNSIIPESEIIGKEYRHAIIDNYRVMNRVSEKTVFIMRIIHSARLLDL
jgi:toxin ParE1/3/4